MSVAALRVSELFGPTVQGEGPQAGRRSIFLRLANCNLDCHWCDSRFSWDWANYSKDTVQLYEPAELAETIIAMAGRFGPRGSRLVLTGGEPMLQQGQLHVLLEALRIRPGGGAWKVDVETNGTIELMHSLHQHLSTLVVSPKLPGSGVNQKRAINEEVLRDWRDKGAHLKVVITTMDDLEDATRLRDELGWHPTRCWAMPEGTTALEVESNLKLMAVPMIERGWNVSGRLHTTIWGNERGR